MEVFIGRAIWKGPHGKMQASHRPRIKSKSIDNGIRAFLKFIIIHLNSI